MDYNRLAPTIKRVAATVNGLVKKKNKLKEAMDKLDNQYRVMLEEKKAKLQAEYDAIVAQQEIFETPIRNFTGGFGTEDLIDVQVIEKGVDKNGKPIRATQYNLRYPDTIIPPTETGCVPPEEGPFEVGPEVTNPNF